MQNYTIKLANLLLFFATGAAIGMKPDYNLVSIRILNLTQNPISVEVTPRLHVARKSLRKNPTYDISTNQSKEIGTLDSTQKIKITPVLLGDLGNESFHYNSILDILKSTYAEKYAGEFMTVTLIVERKGGSYDITKAAWKSTMYNKNIPIKVINFE